MTDKIVILAGGISSRMKKKEEMLSNLDAEILKDADEKQKAMIGIGDNHRPFLDYLLFNLAEAGIKTAVIVIGEKDDSIKNYYVSNENNINFEGLEIKYAVQPVPEGRTKPPGTADALYHGLISVPEWKGESFLVCNSDNLYSVEAVKTLMYSEYPNAMIDYDREGLDFDSERISGFAVTQKTPEGFLTDIIEKPSGGLLNEVQERDGYIGVSMNIFKFSYNMILPCLEETPFHPLRNEKELPTSIKIMIGRDYKSMFTYKMSEHVPDLTSKKDIIPVQEYLKKAFSNKIPEKWAK